TLLHDADKDSVSNLAENFGALVGLGFLHDLDALLKEAPIQRQELAVKLPITYRKMFLMESGGPLFMYSAAIAGMGFSATATLATVGNRIGPGKDPIEDHPKNLAQARDRYQEKNGTSPPPAIHDRDCRAVLSWRVALLPYLGEEALYHEFKLDEPWD